MIFAYEQNKEYVIIEDMYCGKSGDKIRAGNRIKIKKFVGTDYYYDITPREPYPEDRPNEYVEAEWNGKTILTKITLLVTVEAYNTEPYWKKRIADDRLEEQEKKEAWKKNVKK